MTQTSDLATHSEQAQPTAPPPYVLGRTPDKAVRSGAVSLTRVGDLLRSRLTLPRTTARTLSL